MRVRDHYDAERRKRIKTVELIEGESEVEGSFGGGMNPGSTGTFKIKRSISAIDNAGKVLWSVDLG